MGHVFFSGSGHVGMALDGIFFRLLFHFFHLFSWRRLCVYILGLGQGWLSWSLVSIQIVLALVWE